MDDFKRDLALQMSDMLGSEADRIRRALTKKAPPSGGTVDEQSSYARGWNNAMLRLLEALSPEKVGG